MKTSMKRVLVCLGLCLALAPSANSQDADVESRDDLEKRIKKLEKRIEKLSEKLDETGGGLSEKEVEDIAEKVAEEEIEKGYARGIVTAGGVEFQIGGKLEVNLVDAQSFSDPVLGATENPDSHLVFDRLRLEPRVDLGKKLEIFAQIDLLPEGGDSLLKEGAFRYEFDADDYWDDVWWFRSRFQVGLDDRFIHIGPKSRVTESYSLVGTAFGRDEEIAFMWEARIGKPGGAPVPKSKKKSELEITPRDEKTSSTTHGPFDFANNPGALTFHFSVGNGYTLSGKAIGKDGSRMSEIIQDDRETDDGLALSSVGLGVGAERDFNWLGEIGILAFFYEDELNEKSVSFLQDDLTIRDGVGNAIAGYGDSELDYASRSGVRVLYHLEAYHLLDAWMDTWPGDGLYMQFQYTEARDGDLRRDGWYAQASYRFSFARPLIAGRYLRYLEPVVRYGELDVRHGNNPALPLMWDREELVAGLVVGVTENIFLKAEYAALDESTGAGSVDNDELLFQLLVEF